MSQSEENPLELLLDEALAEYLHRCDKGEPLDRESFLARHPSLRDRLEELLNAADWIELLAGPTIGDLGRDSSGRSGGASDHPEDQRAAVGLSAPGVAADISSEETLPHVTVLLSSPSPAHSVPAHDRSVDAPETPPGPIVRPTLPLSFAGGGIASGERGSTATAQTVLPCRFGDYELQQVLGRGGMGVVYAARQLNLDRTVAVKMIRSGALASAEEVRRFYAEARNAARLDHPNIVTVYQCGEIEGHHYFSMDFVEGTDLSRMSKDRPLPGKVAARYVRDVALAIQFAHDRGILHRDLKPANVLVDQQDRVHITDFGLAKSIGHDTGLTASGAALGTPSYMSPEQAAGRIDEHHHATDIYSLGAVLYSLVTGQPPFKASSILQTIMHVIHRPAPRARTSNKEVHEDLETIIDVCLQKSAERRYPTAQALADDLDRYLAGVPIQARPVSKARRAWYWLLGVPIFGAILDHRVVEPTEAHRWVQRGLISIALLMLCAWILMLIPSTVWYKNRMPRQVRFASGVSGGNYDAMSSAMAERLQQATGSKTLVLTSDGSSDNLELLINGKADLAMLQADALGDSAVAVVAPLYYEVVHIIVRSRGGLNSLAELRNQQVIVGSHKGGSQAVAARLLQRAGLGLHEVDLLDADWRTILDSDSPANAAIAVMKAGSSEIRDLLRQGDYTLLPVPNAWEFALEEPAFHSFIVSSTNYPDCPLPESGITTVATTAYLATRFDSSPTLIQQVLAQLYAPGLVDEMGILSAERAAHWQGIAWHPTARDFFQSYRGISAQVD